MYDEKHFTHDAAIASFDDDVAGITVDDGEPTFDWDDVERVTVDDPPYAEAFDSKEFYKLSATVAKPIPQKYHYREDSVTLMKPRGELKKAAWSLDNAPWTLGHPSTGMVKDVDSVRGFWSDPRYMDSMDDLDADLYVPVDDSEAKQFIEENGDVSVGFYNRVARVDEYDGVVNGSDEVDTSVEGFQTDMLFDHCASVAMGRCSSEEGCGLDDHQHGELTVVDDSFKKGTRITDTDDDVDETTSTMQSTTDQPSGIHVADGTWFAVGPDEHPDESTEWPDDAKFPVDSCDDIRDAWNLRGTGDISIDESTLEARIKRAAEAKDCPEEFDTDGISVDAIAESVKQYSICGSRKDVMDNRDCGCNENDNMTETDDNTTMEINFDDLSTEAAFARLEAQHDGAEDRLEELRAAEDAADVAEDAAEELELDDVSELADAVSMREDRIVELEQKVDELQEPQMKEDAEYIAEHTDRYGEDAEAVMEELDEDADTIAEKRELVEDIGSQYDDVTANSGETSESTDSGVSGKYASTPW